MYIYLIILISDNCNELLFSEFLFDFLISIGTWIWWFWNSWFVVEIVSSKLYIRELVITNVKTSISIIDISSVFARSIKIGSWDVWEFNVVFISSKNSGNLRLWSCDCKLGTLSPVLNWSPLIIDKKMFSNGDY